MRITKLANGIKRVGVEVKRETVEAVICTHGRVRAPWEEVIESQLDSGKEFIPQIHGKLGMGGGKGSKDVVFCGADETLGKIGAVVVRGNELDGRGGRARSEERANIGRRLVVRDEVSYGMAGVGEKGKYMAVGVEISSGGAVGLRGEARKTTKGGYKDVFISSTGAKGKTTC